MGKGFIFAILMILLVGTVVAQTPSAQAIPSQLMSAVSEMLENVIEINEKTCSDEPILLEQQIFFGTSKDYPWTMSSPEVPSEIGHRDFLLIFPLKEGELVSINNMAIRGYFKSHSNVGDTCELLINNVPCVTYVKVGPNAEDEHFYDTLPSSCTNSLNLEEFNKMEMTCPIVGQDGGITVQRVFYDVTWKSC